MRKLSIFLAFILVLASAQAFAQCAVTIDNVAGSWNDGGATRLSPGVVNKFNFRCNVTCDMGNFGFNISNAFVVSSPDGADWGYVQGAPDVLVWGDIDGITGFRYSTQFFNHFNKTGGTGAWGMPQTVGAANVSGTDSIGVLFAGAAQVATRGMRGGFNGIPYGITIQPTMASVGKNICIDTAYTPGGQWKWPCITITHASITPAWYPTPQCFEVKVMPDQPPNPVTAVTNYSFNHCVVGTQDMVFTEVENEPPYTFVIVSGSGSVSTVNGNTCRWTWNTPPQSGFETVVIQGYENVHGATHVGNTWTINVTVTNDGPEITCPTGLPVIMGGDCKNVTVTATDDCDPLVWSVGPVAPVIPGDVWEGTVTVANGVYTVCPTANVTNNAVINITAQVTDGLVPVECTFQVKVIQGAPFAVKIEKDEGPDGKGAYQGMFTDVDLTLTGFEAGAGLGGFDLLVAYDNSALSFQLAGQGQIYADCGWEYFTYRFGADGNCGNGCPTGLTRVIGIAETNNGPHHPTCDVATVPVTLAYLRFLVSNDRNLECQYAPVRFYWFDCGDNTLSDQAGDSLFISAAVFEYYDGVTWPQINNGTSGFPTYLGAQNECLIPAFPNKPAALRYVDFYNGGVDIACADEIDARGDINLNGIAYEIADAVMFTNYFIVGLGAFDYVQGAIAASDVNADGIPLTVGDLVYLIRVVVGDALPYPKTAPLAVNYGFENGKVSIDAEMGAAYLVFEGSVTPTLLANNMIMKFGEQNGNTHVLVYSDQANQTFNGAFLQVNGTLVSSEFATYEGQPVAAKNVPKTFSVQNYPNPFNPTTNIEFALPNGGAWTVNVYNVAGQLVKSFSGTSEAGIESVEWNASDNASGVYFYKVTNGDNSITKKAVLLK